MKAVFIVLAFAISVLGEKEFLKSHSLAVKKEHKNHCVTDAKTNINRAMKIEGNEKIDMEKRDRCYVDCMLRESKIMNEKGHFDLDKMTEKMSKDLAKDVRANYKKCDKGAECGALATLDCLNKIIKEKPHQAKIAIAYVGM